MQAESRELRSRRDALLQSAGAESLGSYRSSAAPLNAQVSEGQKALNGALETLGQAKAEGNAGAEAGGAVCPPGTAAAGKKSIGAGSGQHCSVERSAAKS